MPPSSPTACPRCLSVRSTSRRAGFVETSFLRPPRRFRLRALYPWPVKPFDKAHPVRGYFNDPRIEVASRAFHFGIDISCPNGTPVYTVRAGKVFLEGKANLAVSDGVYDFGYWHVVPAVTSHQQVAKGELIGHVQAPWLHVHFAEHRKGRYYDPLRPGALTPWSDTTAP